MGHLPIFNEVTPTPHLIHETWNKRGPIFLFKCTVWLFFFFFSLKEHGEISSELLNV